MCDEPTTRRAAGRAPRSAKSLTRLAQALEVPVSSFYDADAQPRPEEVRADPSETAMLMLVGSYLASIDTLAQRRFLVAVQAIVEAL